MADRGEILTNKILSKIGASSITDLAELLPSPHTTDIYIKTAEEDLKVNNIEDAFHKLSLTHATLLHQCMLQRLHKTSHKRSNDPASESEPDTLASEKVTLSAVDKDETLKLLQKLPSDWTVVQITSSTMGEANLPRIGCNPSTPGLYIARCSCGPSPTITFQTVSTPQKDGVRGIVQEVEIIKEENKIINKDYRGQHEKYWKKREELDNRMKCVVRSMAVAWLQHWSCLLIGGLHPREQKLLEEVTSRILSTCKMSMSSNQIQLFQSIAALPWEMVWVLRDRAVTRMPSLRMLAFLYEHHASCTSSILVQGVNPSKGFYVLDPESNLPRTRARLKNCFAESGWPGITAKAPTHEQFKDALTNQDLFVYVGHGSGSQYMPGEIVEGVECRAVVFLYGCSSVRLASRGRIPEPWGVVLSYLVAYCPCVIGMLWEVTDKDTDNLTQEMLNAVQGKSGKAGSPLENPPADLALLVAQARSVCNWYLTKAAVCVYGLPVHILNNNL
ncbi:separin isoform X2 [Macrobrachium rosenbergii]|uniref:separin isoform X2 n=1 Tax=Macrobrachium rosenbergii TaxID=79674 RepID=UPI0034D5DDE5